MKTRLSRSTPHSSISRSHAVYLGLLILIGGITLLFLYASQDMLRHPFNSTADATIYAQVGFRLNDPRLYANDPVIPIWARDFPTVFFALLPARLQSLQNVGPTYLSLGLTFGLVFAAGVYLLIYEVFGKRDVALLTALIAMLVSRSLMQTPGGWGARLITPRYTVFGLSPSLLWLYWRWRQSWKVVFVFASLGILLLMHPRFSIYPATLLGVGLLTQHRPSLRHWSRVGVRVAPFAPFLLIILWMAIGRLGATGLSGEGGAPTQLGAFDFPGGLARQLFFSGVDAAVPLALGLMGWFSKKESEGIHPDEREAFVLLSVLPILIYAAFWLAIQWFPFFRLANVKRFLTWAYLVPYAWASYWVTQKWHQGVLSSRLLAALGLAALMTVTYSRVQANILGPSVTYRRLVDWTYQTFASEEVQAGHGVILADAAEADDIEQDWQSFYDLCDWARGNTTLDSVFVIPPRSFSVFRLYSQRSLYVMAKNVGLGSLYDFDGYTLWERYEAATTAYTSGTVRSFQELRALGRADYVVVERDKLTLDLPLAYENRRYRVYDLAENSSRP